MSFANVGSADRIIRILIGVALIAYAVLQNMDLSSALGIIMLVVGAILIATGFISFCPLYRVLGLRTKP